MSFLGGGGVVSRTGQRLEKFKNNSSILNFFILKEYYLILKKYQGVFTFERLSIYMYSACKSKGEG